jgi:hypothetical protein
MIRTNPFHSLPAAILCWLATLLISGQAHAGVQDFTLVNDTGDVIEEIYISPTAVEEWEEDVMGQDILDEDERVVIQFGGTGRDSNVCLWDLKVIYADGEAIVWHEINLCNVSTITLHWNENSGQTSATLE